MSAVTKLAPLFLICLSGTVYGQQPAETVVTAQPPPAATAPVEAARPSVAAPSPLLQNQIDLNNLNAAVSAELQRIQGEVQIEQARQGLDQMRHGEIPTFVGSFKTPQGRFAEFRSGSILLERAPGQWLSPEWRVEEIHADRVVLCRKQSKQCRTETPSLDLAATTATK